VFSALSVPRGYKRDKVQSLVIFIRDKPIFSPEKMLHKDYDRKGSVEKRYLVVSLEGLDAKAN
jgi:hypothetical protein